MSKYKIVFYYTEERMDHMEISPRVASYWSKPQNRESLVSHVFRGDGVFDQEDENFGGPDFAALPSFDFCEGFSDEIDFYPVYQPDDCFVVYDDNTGDVIASTDLKSLLDRSGLVHSFSLPLPCDGKTHLVASVSCSFAGYDKLDLHNEVFDLARLRVYRDVSEAHHSPLSFGYALATGDFIALEFETDDHDEEEQKALIHEG